MKLNIYQIKQIKIGLITSLFLLLILIIGASLKLDIGNVFFALAVSQLGFGLLWLVARMGLFSTSSLGARKYAKNKLERKNKRLGVYDEKDDRTKIKIKEYNNAVEITEDTNSKSKAGIYTMLFFGTIELFIAIIISLV